MDEIIKNNIQLKYKGIPTRIDLVQYTNAMTLVFVLTDYPIPSGATARIYVKKPSGKEVYNEATISGDAVTVSTTTQMTAEAGANNAQLQIVKGSIVAASFVFYLHVQPNIAEDTAIESSNEYGVLDGLIADANNLIDQARAALGGITPINNLTSTDASKPLAAPMGKLLDDKISSLNADLDSKTFLIPRRYTTSGNEQIVQISISNRVWASMNLLGLVIKNEAASPTVFTCSAFRMPDSTLKNPNITILSGTMPITWEDGQVTIQIGKAGIVTLLGSFLDVTVTKG